MLTEGNRINYFCGIKIFRFNLCKWFIWELNKGKHWMIDIVDISFAKSLCKARANSLAMGGCKYDAWNVKNWRKHIMCNLTELIHFAAWWESGANSFSLFFVSLQVWKANSTEIVNHKKYWRDVGRFQCKVNYWIENQIIFTTSNGMSWSIQRFKFSWSKLHSNVIWVLIS